VSCQSRSPMKGLTRRWKCFEQVASAVLDTRRVRLQRRAILIEAPAAGEIDDRAQR
jgi:hypothetical protein